MVFISKWHTYYIIFGQKFKLRKFFFRRKPQNLTPPLSSDGGSSTSGQSPTSTHNGSPPPAVKRPSSMSNEKYIADGPTSKKQRISHCRKEPVNHDNTRSEQNSVCPVNCDDDNFKMFNYRRSMTESRDLNPRTRESDDILMRSSSYYR